MRFCVVGLRVRGGLVKECRLVALGLLRRGATVPSMVPSDVLVGAHGRLNIEGPVEAIAAQVDALRCAAIGRAVGARLGV